VNIVPTQYWIDERSRKYQQGVCHPDNWAENQRVDYYCSKQEWNSNCEPFSDYSIQRFEKGIKACIQKVCLGIGLRVWWSAAPACCCESLECSFSLRSQSRLLGLPTR